MGSNCKATLWQNNFILRNIPTHGPLVQPSNSNFGICKFLEGIHSAPIVPLQCGHGRCTMPIGHSRSSLLGSEFVEHEEPPPICSQELISIATDLNNMAWIKSGLEGGSSSIQGNTGSYRTSQGATGFRISEPNLTNGHALFDSGQKNLIETSDALSTHRPAHSFSIRTEVDSLS